MAWARHLGESDKTLNRKVWEWAYTLQAFQEAGVLHPGRCALGFGCGQEPVPAALAARGLKVVATDQPAEGASQWAESGQHAASLAALSRPSILADSDLERHVTFVAVDMNDLPDGLGEFDAIWSSCAFEHLGSIQAGLEFVLESMKYLAPNGVAVHTTEFDVNATEPAIDLGAVVFYRRRDIEALVLELRHRGFRVRCNYQLGTDPDDLHVDEVPYSDVHVRVRVGPAETTSFGLIVKRPMGRRISYAASLSRRAHSGLHRMLDRTP
jgi:hypothetical protein